MSLVQVTHVDIQPEGFQRPPAADPEYDLLHQARLAVAGIELGGDAAIERRIERVVAVEQVERHAADVDPSDA